MLRRHNLGTLVALACLAEVLAFVAVVDWIGFGPALLLGFGATLLGVARLRRVGMSALSRLRDVAEGRASREDAFIDGALSALGAILLVLPGFLTDAVGLALLAPSGRDWVRRRIGVAGALRFAGRPEAMRRPEGSRRSDGPATIDLDAGDWSPLDRARPR